VRRTTISLAIAGALCAGTSARAQITTDGTLGVVQSFNGVNTTIPASLGRQAGGNLFHSFGAFSVPTGGSAIFSGPGSVANVISRVTGGQASSIDGRLGSSIQGANLFLINPRGILFGPNASLDLTGSFTASTANYLKLADGTRFEATATANPILTSAPPAAFGFLGPTGEIALQGTRFDLAAKRGVSIAGGTVSTDGAFLRTRAADLRLAGVASGELPVDAAAAPSAGSVAGNVSIAASQVRTLSNGTEAPGRLVIRGGQLAIADSIVRSTNGSPVDAPPLELHAAGDLVFSGGQLLANAQGAGRGADIVARGGNLTFDRLALVQSWSVASGHAGDIDFAAQNALRLYTSFDDPGWMQVNNAAFADGNAGATRLSGDTVTVDGSIVNNVTLASGSTGPVVMRGREVSLTNGAFVLNEVKPDAPGRGADVDIAATERFFVGKKDCCGFQSEIVTVTRGPQDAGKVRVVAPLIEVVGGTIHSITAGPANAGALEFEGETVRFLGGNGGIAFVDTTAEWASSGRGGDITVRASKAFEIGRGDTPDQWSRMSTSTSGSGRGGSIAVDAPSIRLLDGERGGAVIFSGTGGTGAGGDVALRGDEVLVRNGAEVFAGTWGDGAGGKITIRAPSIALTGGAVTTRAAGSGAAGSVLLDGATVRVAGDGTRWGLIESDVGNWVSGHGGNITLRASELVELKAGAQVSSLMQWGSSGNGGNVLVEAPRVVMDGPAMIYATTGGSGASGSILVRARDVDLRAGTSIASDANSLTPRQGGDITIEADRLTLATTPMPAFDHWHLRPEGSYVVAWTARAGRAGNVTINAREVLAGLESEIVSYTIGAGDSGTVTINADRVKLVDSSAIVTTSDSTGNFTSVLTGNAGRIVLNISDSFEMSDRNAVGPGLREGFRVAGRGGVLSNSVGPGDAGSVVLRAPNVLLDDARIQTATGASGRGGQVEIHAGNLILRNGGQIDAKALAGSAGDAGSITVEVGNRFEISGMSPIDGAFSGVNAETLGSGRGGDVRIAAGTLLVDRGFVRSSTGGAGDAGTIDIRGSEVALRNGGTIDAGTAAGSTGAGGSASVTATGSIVVAGIDRSATVPIPLTYEQPILAALFTPGRAQGPASSSISSNTAGSGSGGNVSLSAPSIRIEDGGRVSTTSLGTGNAGSIDVAASDALRIFGGSAISSEALKADGGNIDVRVGNLVHLKNSEITTAVGSGLGSGGNIFIDPTFVILENSRITANAFGGSGGNIRIIATYFLNTLDSLVDASSQAGLPGTVQISSPNTNLSTQLKVLPAAFFDATQLVREACAGRGVASGAGGSSLVGVGRGGLAASPERLATSTYFGDAPSAVSSAPTATGLKLTAAVRARLAADCTG